MTITPVIRMAGLTKAYGDLEVFRGGDIDVPTGSILAFARLQRRRRDDVVKFLATPPRADAGTATVTGFDVVTRNRRAPVDQLRRQFAAVDEILTGRENRC